MRLTAAGRWWQQPRRGSVEVIREVAWAGCDSGRAVLDELVAQMQVGLMNSKVSVLKALKRP